MSRSRSLDNYIRHERAQPLSVSRLKTYVKRKGLRFLDYGDITKQMTIEQILGPGGAVCILWSDDSKKIGHYTLCAKRSKHLLWFDPTGLAIHRLAEVTNNPFVLQRKLEREKHVVYNRVKYQKNTQGHAKLRPPRGLSFQYARFKRRSVPRCYDPQKIIPG